MATHFLPLSKICVLHIYSSKANHLCQISWELVKNWGSSSRWKIWGPIFAIICQLPWQHSFIVTVEKLCLALIYTPRQTSLPNFTENWWKTEEVVRDGTDFSPIFAIICAYTNIVQHSFCHCRKMCLDTSYTPRHLHLCQISWGSVGQKAEEVVRDARLCDRRPTARPHDTLIPILTPLNTLRIRIVRILCQNWGSSSRRKIFPPWFCLVIHAVTMAEHSLNGSLSIPMSSCTSSTVRKRQTCSVGKRIPSWELVKNWAPASSRRKNWVDRPPEIGATTVITRPTARTDDTLIPIYPPYTLRVNAGV